MKILVGAVAALSIGAGSARALDVQSACASAVYAYAAAWDTHDGRAFGALFTDDGVLDLGFGAAKGRAAIAELFAKRNPGATTRHLMTNVVVTPRGAGAADGVSSLLLFAAPGSAADKPLEAPGFALVGEYRDRFVVDGGACRFADRRLITIFRPARPTPPASSAPPPR